MRPWRESNSRLPRPKRGALSTELQGQLPKLLYFTSSSTFLPFLWYITYQMLAEREYPFQQKVVSLGGGTGHFAWLSGAVQLNLPEMITAIPATWDSGGSSGRLRVKEGILPPGDYMQCLLALMEDEDQRKEAIKILRDRSGGDPLVNLLAAKAEKAHHGVEGGIDGLRRLFRIRAKIVLPTLTDVDLNAKTKHGVVLEQEHTIDDKKNDKDFCLHDEISRIYLDPEAEANPRAVNEILNAQKVVTPPGSPYTSVFPHLLIEGIAESILESEAKLVVVGNLMTTPGEDHHLRKISRWLSVFQYYLGDKEWIAKTGRSRINYLVVNANHIDPEILNVYENHGQVPVEVDEEECRRLAPGLRVVSTELVEYDKPNHLLRHDSLKLAKTVLSL